MIQLTVVKGKKGLRPSPPGPGIAKFPHEGLLEQCEAREKESKQLKSKGMDRNSLTHRRCSIKVSLVQCLNQRKNKNIVKGL